MQSTTKTRLLLVAFTLIVLGWAFPEWRPHGFVIPYYEETAANLRTLRDELQAKYASARTSPYGVFVQHNLTVIGGIYGLFGLLLLLKPRYRDDGWKHLGAICFGFMAFVVWFVVGDWVAITCHNINDAHGGHWAFQRGLGSLLISIATGIVWPLLTIALGLTLWIGIPLYLLVLLFTLPSVLFVILRLLVQLSFLAYHHLHYLTVAHPAEQVYKNGMAKGVPLPDLARDVARAMYVHDLKIYEQLPPVWKLRNQKRRMEEAEQLLHAGRSFMRELEKCVLQDARLRD